MMGMFDGLIGQVMQSHEVENLAAKIGPTPDQVAASVNAPAPAHLQPRGAGGVSGGIASSLFGKS